MADNKGLNRIRSDVLVGCSIIFSVIMVIAITPRALTPGGGRAVALAGAWVGVSMLSLVLARSGRWLRVSSLLYCISLFAILVLLQLNVGFFPAPALLGFFLVPTLAGFLLGGAAGLAFGLLGCGLTIALKVSLPPWNDPNFVALTGTILVAVCVISIALPAIIAVYDRSHRSVNNELSQARAEALGASAAKSKFLANMSHELRTPMVGVLGAADLLARTKDRKEQRHLIGVLRRSAQAQLDLIGNILDFTRIEADQLQLEHASIELRALLSDLLAMFRTAAEAKGLRLTISIDEELPEQILGDPFRLQQILSNLLNNAIKFTEQGEVRVVAQPGPGERVEFAVHDTGIGFASALGEEIFATFVQADSTTARRFGGSGLGLAICRRLIVAMGGTIAAQSTPGHGSIFKVILPAVLPSDSARLPTSEESLSASIPGVIPSSCQATVLLADDEAVNRIIIAAMLATLGHRVLEAVNGREALEILDREAVDVILLDMHMPELDGPGVVQRIRSAGGERASLPIIGLTADVVREHLDRYLEHGLDEILSKPISIEGLRDALDRALDARDVSSSASPTSTGDLGVL